MLCQRKSENLVAKRQDCYTFSSRNSPPTVFYYKGSNVVGAANNSNEAAKSAFAFMISSIVSKYKDVVHVLPTCKINAVDLFVLIH